MTGPVEWAVLLFVVSLIVGTAVMMWRVRSYISAIELRFELKLAEFQKDIRHLKGNVAQQGIIGNDLLQEQIKMQAEVNRLAKLVNGAK